ncbi:hypothetical protein FB45DRAFT_910407 [Roridomyces roridus]|uniref:Uncharacterized protein n=1 Tax=Roridomyces roridus TaxID=1738132 RepID=A0AAD7BZQ3_9AGAR|nr:hypothetical protein FB45DRAFT_910407 [Roridomyces roridus]
MTATTAKVANEARALQTRTSTTSTSTVSSTSTATQLPSRAGGFPLKGAPPFILGLLAIGIFAVGMIIFFGSRRRAAAAQRSRLASAPLPPVFDARPPRLWDIWSPRGGLREEKRGQWKDIQPLSATIWDEARPEPPVQPALPHNSMPHRDPILAAAFSHLRRRYLRPRLEEDLPIESTKLPTLAQRVVRLQIAVTIAMPSIDLPADEKLDYVIGLHETPWQED